MTPRAPRASPAARNVVQLRRRGQLVSIGGRLTREEAEALLDLVDSKRSSMDVIDREDQRILDILGRLDTRLRVALGQDVGGQGAGGQDGERVPA